ncbi:RPR [Desmophyllum pertusum]|uniref:RPR n=1 Tax=Desmophyllum pertusum TaxID=174260 RepID=A0A9W9ZQ05_9CNID|nr:RPR [Desmophyllum pertusum]
MGDMEIVRQFNSELSTIYETKPPISKAKVASVTRLAVKAIKYYKHVVQSIEKFAQKCRQEYKLPALYVIDSVIRQSRHQFGAERDVYGPRFAKNIRPTFQHLFRCTPEEQGKVIKVLNLWQKNDIYPPEVIQPLLNLPSTLEEVEDDDMPTGMETFKESTVEMPESQPPMLTTSNPLATVLEEQRQEHMHQIQLLQQKLQEQQRINEQQQQQIHQQHLLPQGVPGMQQGVSGMQQGVPVPGMRRGVPGIQQGVPVPGMQQGVPGIQQGVPGMQQGVPGMQQASQEPLSGYEAPHQSQVTAEGAMSVTADPQGSGVPPPMMGQQQPKFQLQPEVYAQIQALTGMNIRIPQGNQPAVPDSSSGPPQLHIPEDDDADSSQSNQMPGFPDGANFGPPPGMPVWAPHGMGPGGVPSAPQGPPQDEERRSSLIDDFDYGDDDDDASRIAEQRRHLLEEERRLSQEVHPRMGEVQGEFQNTFRPVGEPDRHPDPAGSFGRRSPDLHPRERSPGGHYHKSRSPRRRSRSPRWRDRSPRRRSRERERDRDRDRGRNRERDRDRDRDRDPDRDREKERGRGSDREAEKRSDWLPRPKKETLSVCSTTIWVGHLAKTVMKENLLEMFEAHRLTVFIY